MPEQDLQALLLTSENLLRPPQRSQRSHIGNPEYNQILVLIPNRAERKSPVLKTESAARAVITHLGNLILKRGMCNVVTRANRRIKSRPRQVSPANQRAYLIRPRLEHEIWRIIRHRRRQIDRRKMRQRQKRLLVRLQLQQRPDRRQLRTLRIEIHDELRVPVLPRFHAQITHHRRKMPRLNCKSKRRQFIRRLEHVALPRNQRPAKTAIETMKLRQPRAS